MAAIERFRRGWHINTLLTSDELQATASAAGFAHESTHELSSYLELRRPRDRVIAALVAPAGWLPWRWTHLDPLLGGTALQTCLANGWIEYEVAVSGNGGPLKIVGPTSLLPRIIREP